MNALRICSTMTRIPGTRKSIRLSTWHIKPLCESGTLGGLEKAINIAKGQGMDAKGIKIIEDKKAEILQHLKDLKTNTSDNETELFTTNPKQ